MNDFRKTLSAICNVLLSFSFSYYILMYLVAIFSDYNLLAGIPVLGFLYGKTGAVLSPIIIGLALIVVFFFTLTFLRKLFSNKLKALLSCAILPIIISVLFNVFLLPNFYDNEILIKVYYTFAFVLLSVYLAVFQVIFCNEYKEL